MVLEGQVVFPVPVGQVLDRTVIAPSTEQERQVRDTEVVIEMAHMPVVVAGARERLVVMEHHQTVVMAVLVYRIV